MKNKKYGLWIVLDGRELVIDGRIYVECRCECGVVRNVIIKNLKSGASAGCGCVGRKNLSKRNFKHGKRFSRAWSVEKAIKLKSNERS